MTDVNGARRHFLKVCGKAALSAPAVAAGLSVPYSWAMEDAPRTQLVDSSGAPLKASALKMHENWTFQYPWLSVPVLMIRLDEPTIRQALMYGKGAQPYYWPGGVGPDRTIVAYVAICAHLLSYNAPDVSYLTYHKARNKLTRHGRAITCCAHGSVYDPAVGGQVLAGPAKHPLAAVVLEYDEETDGLTATGIVGTDLHRKFFRAHRRELRKTYGRKDWRRKVADTTVAMPLQEWTKLMVRC